MTFQDIPPELLDNVFSDSISDWLSTDTPEGGFRGTWSSKSRKAYKDLRNHSNLNRTYFSFLLISILIQYLGQYRCIVHDIMRRAIRKLDEVSFTEHIGKAVRESPADHLFVVQLAYSPERLDRFRETGAGSSFKTLLLCLASINGRYEVVEYLLSKGADLEDTAALECMERWRARMTPLHYSVKRGHKDTAHLLLNHGANVNSRAHSESMTPLQEAVKFPDVLRLLLANGADVGLESPLHDAAVYGSADAIELLISYGAEVDRPIADETPLMQSSQASNIETTRKLLEKGANVNAQIQDPDDLLWGATPLYHAITCKRSKDPANQKILEILLEFGADINKSVSTSDGPRGYMPAVSTKSPLAIAVNTFNPSAIKLLLERDAEWKDTDPNCPTPLQALMHHDRRWCREEALSMLKVILEHGANPNEYSCHGETPLVVACCHRPLSDARPAIKELLRCGAIVTKPCKNGLSPLRAVRSSQHSSADMMDVLQDLYDFSTGPASETFCRMIDNVKTKIQEAGPGGSSSSLTYQGTTSDSALETDSPCSQGSSEFWMSDSD